LQGSPVAALEAVDERQSEVPSQSVIAAAPDEGPAMAVGAVPAIAMAAMLRRVARSRHT
jgi:hypothetical protein